MRSLVLAVVVRKPDSIPPTTATITLTPRNPTNCMGSFENKKKSQILSESTGRKERKKMKE